MFGFFKRKRKELRVTAACGCNIGRVRSNNEDNLCFDGIVLPPENRGLDDILYFFRVTDGPVHFGVFDGMGGEAYGELAALLAATEVRDLPKSADVKELVAALHRANEKICAAARERDCGLIGTTAAVLTVDSGDVYITNIGDSKVYRFRNGVIEQLSTDHTDRGVIDQHGIKGRKPRLTQHLGIESAEMVIEPAVRQETAFVGDRYVICSDGLSDMVTEEELATILSANGSLDECVNKFISEALKNGGKDNVTVIAVAID